MNTTGDLTRCHEVFEANARFYPLYSSRALARITIRPAGLGANGDTTTGAHSNRDPLPRTHALAKETILTFLTSSRESLRAKGVTA